VRTDARGVDWRPGRPQGSAGATRPDDEPPATRRRLVSARIAPCSETPFLAVRHGLEIVDSDDCQVWRESFAPAAFLAAPTPAPVTLQHDSPTIGRVTVVTAFREWHVADMVIEADAD